ncbi:hypothetical protein JTE90_014608 [Oedothorax gibbosus]|uniref:Uncharacterized protein n=1 Tax=Oedothorax gibbosus TaxID=931172 RepID=A0AAV6VAR5_9ARAC|nr:hypothetical protein JTE90_014608 [Oedothorax gibbosus]
MCTCRVGPRFRTPGRNVFVGRTHGTKCCTSPCLATSDAGFVFPIPPVRPQGALFGALLLILSSRASYLLGDDKVIAEVDKLNRPTTLQTMERVRDCGKLCRRLRGLLYCLGPLSFPCNYVDKLPV